MLADFLYLFISQHFMWKTMKESTSAFRQRWKARFQWKFRTTQNHDFQFVDLMTINWFQSSVEIFSERKMVTGIADTAMYPYLFHIRSYIARFKSFLVIAKYANEARSHGKSVKWVNNEKTLRKIWRCNDRVTHVAHGLYGPGTNYRLLPAFLCFSIIQHCDLYGVQTKNTLFEQHSQQALATFSNFSNNRLIIFTQSRFNVSIRLNQYLLSVGTSFAKISHS